MRQLIYSNDENAIRMMLDRHLPHVPFPENTTPLMYAVLLADINIVSGCWPFFHLKSTLSTINWLLSLTVILTKQVKLIREANSTDTNAAENVSGLTALMFAAIIGYDAKFFKYF